MHDHSTPEIMYRCVCGEEFAASPVESRTCPKCSRLIPPNAFSNAATATVSVRSLDHEPDHETSFQLDDRHHDPMVGQSYGHFRLEECIGRGGMGKVYRALDTSLQRYVAVKVLRSIESDDIDREHSIARIMQEAVSQARMKHPNIATVYYVGKHDSDPFFAMELVDGGSLRDSLRGGPLPYAQVVAIALQIASALKHASEYGVVHADIKPSNLLLSQNSEIKLSDFGLSRQINKQNEGDSISGTPAYFAPELLEGSVLTQKSDMYALGVTLFELTFGRYPFQLTGSTIRERLQTHQTAEIEFPNPWPDDLPHEFALLLEKLLNKEPENRFNDYDELISELNRVQPVSTTSAGLALRATAFVIDQSVLAATFLPFAGLISYIKNSPGLSRYQFVSPFIVVLWLLIPIAYIFMIRMGIRSAGRYLFQLRVVDNHGLFLRKPERSLRELMRSCFTFASPVVAFVGNVSDYLLIAAIVCFAIFVSANTIFLAITGASTAIHDFFTQSKVVLDVDASASA